MIYGLYDKAGPVNVWRSYNLYAGCSGDGDFGHEGGYVLVDVRCQHCLDQEHVVPSLYRFEHAEIVHISVIVEVQVGEHV